MKKKKKIDAKTAKRLCDGCIHRREMHPGCARCFVQVLGEWQALGRETAPRPKPDEEMMSHDHAE